MSVLISGVGIAGPTLAYWLSIYGINATLIERAPHLRTGGYAVDFWGRGYDIAERMGILPDLKRDGYEIKELQLVNYHLVETASSMKEARIIAAKSHFDLLISDIGLPDGNGCDLFNELQNHSPIKGIALTGYGMEDDIARSEAVGFSAHLTKPVHMQSLEDALAKAMNSI